MKKITALSLALIMILSFCPASLAEEPVWDREEFYAQSIENFNEFDYSDPMHITDEEFFGVWGDDAWEIQPLFDYASYPNMAEIEKAAMAGDYEKCREELLTYYRDRYATFNIPDTVSKAPSEKTLVGYEALFDNFVPTDGGSSIAGRVIVGKEPSWVSMNLTDDVQSVAKKNEKKRIYQFAAARKDGYTARIDSIESGNGAYVEVLVNGTYKRFNATKDNYVQIENIVDNFSSSDNLLVEESVSSIGTSNLTPIDNYTKNAYIEFDFTGLMENDQIEDARLYIHANMEESDCPAGVRIPSDVKSLYVLPYTKDASLDIDSLTFQKYKSYEKAYTSYDGDKFCSLVADRENGIVDMTKNTSAIFSMQSYILSAYDGYLATGDETFAFHVIRTLITCIQEGGSYEEKIRYHDNENYNANMAFSTMVGLLVLPKYMKYLIKSEHMTPDKFITFMKYFWECGEVLVKTWGHGEEANNWGGYNCTGLQYLYLFYPEFYAASAPLIDTPRDERYPGSVTGGWAEVEQFRRAYKTMGDFDEDGTAIERSTQYSFEGLNTLLNVLDISDIVDPNLDTKSLFSEEMLDRIEKAAVYLMNHMNPRFGDWQVGDAGPYAVNYATRIKRVTRLVENNPYLNYCAATRLAGTKPPYLTVVGDKISKVTFRNSWEENAVAAHLENAGGTGSHGHNDDLSLTVAAYGQYLLVDPLMGDYQVSEPMERWASSTRGHNTIEINDTIGKGSKYYHEGDTDLFGETMIVPLRQYNKEKNGDLHPENREINQVYDFVRAESFAYEDHNRMDYDYKLMRDVLFMHNGYFIVTDYIDPEDKEDANKYKQLWHFLPDANISVDRDTNSIRSNFDGNANVVVATVKKDSVKFPEIKEGLYASTKGNFQTANYGIFEQNNEGVSTFNTIIYPLGVGEKSKVSTRELAIDIPKTKASAFVADIENEDNGTFKTVSYYSLMDTSLQGEREFGAYITDGEVALAEKTQDKYTTALLRNGKLLKDEEGINIILSSQNISDLGVEWKENSVYLASSKADDIDLGKLTVYSGKTADSVYLNGEAVTFSQSGKYLYFGDKPIIDDSGSDDAGTSDNKKEPIHGGGGSGGGGGGGSSSDSGKDDGKDKETEVITPEKPEEKPEVDTQKFSVQLKDHWAEAEISELIKTGIITGDDSGNLNLSETITRAEFIAMLVRAMKLEDVEYDGQFEDVEKESWYASYIAAAFENKIIEGDGKNAHPNRKITRQEMTKMVASVIEDGEEVISKNFADESDISDWAKKYVDIAVSRGLVNGMENGEFRPLDNAKREQAMVLIYRLLKLNNN